jgi:VWFA-related protein
MRDVMSTPSRRDAAAARRKAGGGLKLVSRAILAALSLSLCLPLSPAASPQETQNVSKPLQYEVSVVLKLIHVYVADAKGKPVEGLTKDDFVVTDNGRPVTVTAFERHLLAHPPRPEEQTGPVPETPAASPPPPAETGRKFFLFIDFAFNDARGIMFAKQAALHFLETEVKPDDEVGLVSYSMLKGLTIHEFLTRDKSRVRRVLDKIGRGEFTGRASEIEDKYWRLVQEPLPARWKGLLLEEARGEREESKRIVETFILNMADLAKALRYVPGQKHFILFSTGVPNSIINGNQAGNPAGQGGNAQYDPGNRTLQDENEAMVKEFSAAGCTFYAFDTRRTAKAANLFGYDEMTFEAGSRGLTTQQDVHQNSKDILGSDKTTGVGSLKRISETTGGKYYSNISQYKGNLDQVQNLTGAFYVLGYSIGQQWDGRFHEVKVKVKREGCEVRAQTGYFNPKPFHEFSKLEKELQLFDLALNGRSDLYVPKTVPLASISYDAGEGTMLRTISRISREALEGIEGKNVEFVALVFDDEENVVSLQRKATDLSGYPESDIIFSSVLTAKPGAYKCRLVIRDLDTGRSAVGSTTAFVPEPSAGFVLFSPLLVAAGGPSVNLDGAVKGTAEALAWREIYPYDAVKYRPIIGEEAVGAGKVVALVPYRVPEAARAQVLFSTHLVDSATGQSRPAVNQPLGRLRHGNVETLVLEFALDDIPPGRYVLFINGSEKTSGVLASAHVPLTIVR